MTDVLVAGGAGFLGSHLCSALIERGYHVTAVDDLSTGRRENVAHLTERFLLIERDVRIPVEWSGEYIYNLASPASPPIYQLDPVRTLLVNVVGTWRLLALAEQVGARFLQASTSEVYGDPAVHPQPEGYRGGVSTTGPRACYDEGKRAAETLCSDYRRRGVDVRIARIFNTYGPRMDPDDGRIITNLIGQGLAGEPLTIYGDGRQTRSMCYVDDTVRGLIALMEHPTADSPVNIGNPDERSVLQIADAVARVTGSDAGVVFRPLPQDDPYRRCPDISLARALLGWEPVVGLDEGIRRTVEAWSPVPMTSARS